MIEIEDHGENGMAVRLSAGLAPEGKMADEATMIAVMNNPEQYTRAQFYAVATVMGIVDHIRGMDGAEAHVLTDGDFTAPDEPGTTPN
jgi:hypothetical protein